MRGVSGTKAYLFLESIETYSQSAPTARLEIEVKQADGTIKREVMPKVGDGDQLFTLSNGLEQYREFVVTDLNKNTDTVIFKNGIEIVSGETHGDVHEEALRRIQIREAIRAHLEKEQTLFADGIKVLTLFFIDEVAKYRVYPGDDDDGTGGEYARIFEEEYGLAVNEMGHLLTEKHKAYLDSIPVTITHNGYFSKDRGESGLLIAPRKRVRVNRVMSMRMT